MISMKKILCLFTILMISLMLMPAIQSCEELSNLPLSPLVMVTAETYDDYTGNFLRFKVRYLGEDTRDLNVKIYDPDGDMAADWSGGSAILEKGKSAIIEGIPKALGEWDVKITGTIATEGDHKGETFENNTVVTVTD